METTIEVRAAPMPGQDEVEVVERKGLGHPDTMCDAMAERAACALARHYLERCGEVLHYNVDKALLVGGDARPAFGGGEILVPIELDLAGRATTVDGDASTALDEVVREAARAWLAESFHALDPVRDVIVRPRLRAGSRALRALFARGRRAVPRANDTSIGVGSAPETPTERVVLAVDAALRAAARAEETAFVGEDVKIMAVRRGRTLTLTVACAMIGRPLRDLAQYLEAKVLVAELARAAAMRAVGGAAGVIDALYVAVNAGDDPEQGDVYLTVTGTSAEAGDDGEVGRGNRVGGLITPGRPMTMEAAAGKNAITHVGKLHGVIARQIARDLVERVAAIAAADVLLVSRIGAPIDAPALAHVRLVARASAGIGDAERDAVREIASAGVARLGEVSSAILAGQVALY
jgi:S-adenosylmethionine synthetase